jgi:hypothetical protein
MERRTNASIMEELKVPNRLSTLVNKRMFQFFGHVVRRDGENLENIIMEGKVEGRRPRGRTANRWVDQVKRITDLPLQRSLRKAEDSPGWRHYIQMC